MRPQEAAAGGASSAAAAGSPIAPRAFPPVLLITPATILTQWQQELREWCPQLICCVCHGADKEQALELVQQRKAHILITSYETALSQLSNVNRIPWSLAILDECHRLKNHEAKSTIAFQRELKIHIKLGLTGTGQSEMYECAMLNQIVRVLT
jgi:SNF2 family DNA or RNA helicase